MGLPRHRGLFWALSAASIIGVSAAVVGWRHWRDDHSRDEAAAERRLPTRRPPVKPAFRNTAPDVAYVGSAACAACHEEQQQSYARTTMSRSACEIDADQEPASGDFAHPSSQRRFVVHRQGGQLWHRELLAPANRPEVVLNEFPLRLRIGSGAHARTYLAEIDGFLVESPVTWYASRGQWDMSPGFEGQFQQGFERPIEALCLNCHVGRFEREGHSSHRYRIVEAAIGCERCHGPGSLHQARHAGAAAVVTAYGAAADDTIVNPRRLPRDLAEAVCQQCHLSGDLTVPAPSRRSLDYRPGLALQDFQQIYSFAEAEQMTVTGHVAQLHRSRCYQASDTLTCTTCHSPHDEPDVSQRVAHYRATCLRCHSDTACRVDPEVLHRRSAANSCVDCHMPAGATDVPHVSFHDHRIGIFFPRTRPPQLPENFVQQSPLEPFHDQSNLSYLQQQRGLGLAYGKAAMHSEVGPAAVEQFHLRSYQILTTVAAASVPDGPVAATLALASYRLELPGVEDYASAALLDPNLDGAQRCDMLFLLADAEFRRGEFAAAAQRLGELVKLRRNAIDWSYLSRCERALGNEDAGLRDLETAARIGGATPRLRQELAEIYRQRGDLERAHWHLERMEQQ